MKLILISILLSFSCGPTFAQAPVMQAPAAGPSPITTSSPLPTATAAQTVQPPQTPAPPKITYSEVKGTGPYVALTFDDGPHATFTPKLLDMLARKNVKATFFIVGENAELYPEIMQRIVAEGHEIANHSWSHPLFTKLSDDAVRSQLSRTQSAILAATGKRAIVMRPPYGGISDRQKRWVNEEFGFKILLWSVDPLDWRKPGSAVVARRLIEGAAPGAILLAHDIHGGTVDAVPDVIDGILAKGLRFTTVSELIAMENSVATPTPTPKAIATPKAVTTPKAVSVPANPPIPAATKVPSTR